MMVNEPLQHDAYGEEFKGLRTPETSPEDLASFNRSQIVSFVKKITEKFESGMFEMSISI